MSKVAIVGHSFVSRLCEFEAYHEPLLGLQKCNTTIDSLNFVEKRGANVGMIRTLLAEQIHGDTTSQTGPDLVFLVIGSNDACSRSQTADVLASSIFGLARYLIVRKFARHVVIGQLLPRFKRHQKYFHPDLSLQDYNQFICDVNCKLNSLVANTNGLVSLWKFRGFWNEGAYATDGCHPVNIAKFANSIKHGILNGFNALLENGNLDWQERIELV